MKSSVTAFLVGGSIGLASHLVARHQPTEVNRKRRSIEFKEKLHRHQDGRCMSCKTKFGIDQMEIDHVTPIAAGGTDLDSNLQLLCRACNRSKGKRAIHNADI